MTQADSLNDADVRRHQRFLEALAQSLGGGEDVVQDTWLRALERGRARAHDRTGRASRTAAEPSTPEGSSRSWLASVLRSQSIDRYRTLRRQRRREIKVARAEATPDSLQPLLEAEALAELHAGLEQLPKEEREVLELRYLEQIPAREIARRRDQPVERVYRQLERGRDYLRRELGEENCFGVAAWAPLLAAKRDGLLAAAAVSWKPLAALAAVVLAGGTWRALGTPPSGSPLDVPPVLYGEASVLNGEDSAGPASEWLDAERPVPRLDAGRTPILDDTQTRQALVQEPASPPAARVKLTVVVGSQQDTAGIQAQFTPRAQAGAPVPSPVSIELPRSGRVTVKLAADTAYDLTLRSPLDKGLQPVVKQSLAALDPGTLRAWSVTIPTAELRGFAGRIVEHESLSPLRGAQVLAVKDSRVLAQSDSAGDFRFDVPREGLGVVRVQAKGFGPALFDTENEGRIEQAEFVIGLERAASLVVRGWADLDPAQMATSGEDIEARVSCHADDIARPRGSRLRIERWQQSPGRQGQDLSFAGLPPGVLLTLELWRGKTLLHRSIESLVLAAGEQRVLDLSRHAERFLVGRLQGASGEGLADREIWLLRASLDAVDPWRLLKSDDSPLRRALTDAQGNFELPEVPEGRWWLGPAPGQEELAPYARLHLQDSRSSTRVDLEAIPIYHVRGRVRLPDGRKGRVQIYASRSDVDESVRAPVEDSLFQVGPLLPGRWYLSATVGAFERSKTVAVDVPAARDSEIELVFEDTLSIAGRVVDGQTAAPENAHVSLVRSGSLSMGTGSDGRFRFRGCKPGTYTLCAQTPDGRVGFLPGVELKSESLEELIVPVFVAARLQLSVKGDGPSPRCQILAKGELYQDFTLDRGVTTLQAVPATSIEVVIYSHANGKRVVHDRRSLLATPGTTEPIEFVID